LLIKTQFTHSDGPDFNDQYQHNTSNALDSATAVWYGRTLVFTVLSLTSISLVIPILTYGFLGVESITTTAFEAFDRNSLRFPARYIAYIMTFLYFLTAIGEAHSVKWSNPSLPDLRVRSTSNTDKLPDSHSAIVLAAQAEGDKKWAAFFTGCMIFFCLGGANTALYISSRTLYGLTRSLDMRETKWYLSWLSIFGTTTPVSQVPGWALLVSAVAFCWLPVLYRKHGFSSQNVRLLRHFEGESH
jgi:yeast amino acid transporter